MIEIEETWDEYAGYFEDSLIAMICQATHLLERLRDRLDCTDAGLEQIKEDLRIREEVLSRRIGECEHKWSELQEFERIDELSENE